MREQAISLKGKKEHAFHRPMICDRVLKAMEKGTPFSRGMPIANSFLSKFDLNRCGADEEIHSANVPIWHDCILSPLSARASQVYELSCPIPNHSQRSSVHGKGNMSENIKKSMPFSFSPAGFESFIAD